MRQIEPHLFVLSTHVRMSLPLFPARGVRGDEGRTRVLFTASRSRGSHADVHLRRFPKFVPGRKNQGRIQEPHPQSSACTHTHAHTHTHTHTHIMAQLPISKFLKVKISGPTLPPSHKIHTKQILGPSPVNRREFLCADCRRTTPERKDKRNASEAPEENGESFILCGAVT